MAIKRDTPLSTSPDPGNMQDYGKYQGAKMKTSKIASLDSKPVNVKKLSENINSGEQRRAAQYAQDKAIEKKKSRTNKLLMGAAAAATIVGERLTDKYFPGRK
jgi:ribosomal protein L15